MSNEYVRKRDVVELWNRCNPFTAIKAIEFGVKLKKLKPVDVAPVIHSRWVLGGYDDMYYACENCEHKQSEYYHKPTAKYCPNCGAKMDGEE